MGLEIKGRHHQTQPPLSGCGDLAASRIERAPALASNNITRAVPRMLYFERA
jgi:hypothetical protein